jgi:UDP:flavonoid glycosyltransferase YjiC (YdhE family)
LGRLHGGFGFVFTPPQWGALFGAPLPTTRRVRFPDSNAMSATPPPWVEGLGKERPFINGSLGTAFASARRVLKAMIAALGDLPVDALVTVGRIDDPHRFSTAISAAADEVLHHSEYRAAALELREGIDAMPSVEHAVDLLEQLIGV